MSLPDIRFQDIRPHDGSRHAGFEELCCQLASLEPRAAGAEFNRKGRGGDAGVECFLRRSDLSETGWQAKYVDGWDASLKGQLDKSIRTALDKHPKLSEYIVCLPFDLPDARVAGKSSSLAQWEAWKAEWLTTAKEERRPLSIERWDKSAISERLARGEPAYAGRLLYWFDQEALSQRWFREQFEKSRAALGSRYLPDTNVLLPIRRDFLGFVRDRSLLEELESWSVPLREKAHCAISSIERHRPAAAEPHSGELRKTTDALSAYINSAGILPSQPIPVSRWLAAAREAQTACRAAVNWAYETLDTKPGSGGSPSAIDHVRHEFYRLGDLLGDIADALESDRWRLANAHQLLLYGAAGTGKSHLLADVVEHQVGAGAPAILVLGSTLNDSEPWRQILTQLDLPPNRQVKHLLAALDAAAEAAGVRALICVDALNERNGPDIWPSRLAVFLKEAEPFPRVVVCVSCRSTYLPWIVPDDLDENALPRLEHTGFAGTEGDAAKRYLDMRGIVRPGAPNLLPEFDNPLFLKTCCDYLEKQGKRELPRGLQGVSAIFGFYMQAVTRVLNQRMKLDPRQDIVPRAIRALADDFATRGEGYASKADATALFEAIHESRGELEHSLLAQLENEGVLAVEPVRLGDGTLDEMVRFTFERFSDHEIARWLLNEHLDEANPQASFGTGTPLLTAVAGPHAYRRAGVIEALAIQVPERVDAELPDLVPSGSSRWETDNAFGQSLLLRDQTRFTKRTLELAQQILGKQDADSVLVEVATEPRNQFNALFLHQRLMAMTMPERDQDWSTFVACEDDEEGGPLQTLIDWALRRGMEDIEDERAELAAITLTWCFSTSNRALRDRATKSLASLLANRLPLARSLVERFRAVDDLYIAERLYAAIYGAVMQGSPTPGLRELAQAVFDAVFAGGTPPLNVLLREHASGIIQYAAFRGELPEAVNVAVALPPYTSPWPIEFVPKELIDTYTIDFGKGPYRDFIVGSTMDSGDFHRYVIERVVDRWNPAPIGSRPLRPSEVYGQWQSMFTSGATAVQTTAFDAVLAAAKNAGGNLSWKDAPEKARLQAAEDAFRATLNSDAWEDYCARAMGYVHHDLFSRESSPADRWPAHFNIGWASRWICKRAHELGWTPERFGNFDRNYGHGDRHNHRLERIGKKYQWLALYDLTARMADNLAFNGDRYGSTEDAPACYSAAREVRLRNIDPSLLVRETHYDGWKEWGKTWWVPTSATLRQMMSPQERLAWRDSQADILNDSSLIDVTNPKDGRRWLVLQSFGDWTQDGLVEGQRTRQRDTWFRLNCIVVRKPDAAKMERFLRGRRLTDRDKLPRYALHGDHYLGEYPWSPITANILDWWPANGYAAVPVETRQVVAEYMSETGGYDHSIDKTVTLQMPAPWLSKSMELHLVSGRELAYAGSDGRIMFYDPSATEPGPAAALVDREAFLATLEREDLVAFWVIAGEKSVYGGPDSGAGWGGCVAHSFVYRLKDGQFTRKERFDREQPSARQLKEFMAN